MDYWRVVVPLVVLVNATPCSAMLGVQQRWLGSPQGPAALAAPNDPWLLPDSDSLAWLPMNRSGWRASGGPREQSWVDAESPAIYRLTREQLSNYVKGAAQSRLRRQWRETIIEESGD